MLQLVFILFFRSKGSFTDFRGVFSNRTEVLLHLKKCYPDVLCSKGYKIVPHYVNDAWLPF